jgi:hypothetical protein
MISSIILKHTHSMHYYGALSHCHAQSSLTGMANKLPPLDFKSCCRGLNGFKSRLVDFINHERPGGLCQGIIYYFCFCGVQRHTDFCNAGKAFNNTRCTLLTQPLQVMPDTVKTIISVSNLQIIAQ